jgi:hypothetical protein
MNATDQQIQSVTSSTDATEAAKLMHGFARDHFHLFLVGQYKIREIAPRHLRHLPTRPTRAEILRSHIVQTSSLRIAGKERDGKTAALYSYITSERFWQHLKSIDGSADKMLDIDAGEKKATRPCERSAGG